jgi:hypothetical protein
MEHEAARQDDLERKDGRLARSPLVAAIANGLVDLDNSP